jgi:hypothetical protein
MSDLTITESELWAAIDAAREASIPRQRPGSITTRQYRERYGVGEKCARHQLSALVAGGTLATDIVMLNGRRERIYWPVTPEQTAETKPNVPRPRQR